MQPLDTLGWDTRWHSAFDQIGRPDLQPMRVIAVHRQFRVLAGPVPVERGVPTGRLRARSSPEDMPTVGDWVLVDAEQATADGLAHIIASLPRRSVFRRAAAGESTHGQVVAANVDTVFLVCSLDRDFNPRRIERYLAALWGTGAQPVVLLNKVDQCPDPQSMLAELQGSVPGVSVHLTSALDATGLDALAPYLLPGRTVALVGSSGVGKSTLSNALLGEAAATHMATGAVRADDQRGRHTTTHRQMLTLPGGAQLIDTPGMRALGLWVDEGAEAGVASAFPDIEALIDQCRFRDCSHQNEPGCAVRAALECGELSPARLANWEKLNRELAFQARRQDESLARLEEAKWKSIQKANRARTRLRNKQRY
ncbi:MAG: ribosome small subunit-dependent GTPase A [Bradymonadia bacterium]